MTLHLHHTPTHTSLHNYQTMLSDAIPSHPPVTLDPLPHFSRQPFPSHLTYLSHSTHCPTLSHLSQILLINFSPDVHPGRGVRSPSASQSPPHLIRTPFDQAGERAPSSQDDLASPTGSVPFDPPDPVATLTSNTLSSLVPAFQHYIYENIRNQREIPEELDVVIICRPMHGFYAHDFLVSLF